MKKLNNKGFLLIETVIVSVFVLAIFVLLLQNGLPLITEYEKRSYYDDIDSVYIANIVKTYLKNNNAKDLNAKDLINTLESSNNGYIEVNDLKSVFDIYGLNGHDDCKVIISKWDTANLKSNMINGIGDTADYNRGLVEYISYVYKTATIDKDSTNDYRIIISRYENGKFYYVTLPLNLSDKNYNKKTFEANFTTDEYNYEYQLTYRYFNNEIKDYIITIKTNEPDTVCENFYKSESGYNSYADSYKCEIITDNLGTVNYVYTYNYEKPVSSSDEYISLNPKNGHIEIPSTTNVNDFNNKMIKDQNNNNRETTFQLSNGTIVSYVWIPAIID